MVGGCSRRWKAGDVNREELGGRASRRHFSMIRSFHLVDLFTLAKAAAGLPRYFAMAHVRQAEGEKVYAVGVLVVLALDFDVLVGRIGRWRHRVSPLGRELDSLAAVISFGVAPACLAYVVGMTGLMDQLGAHILCGVWDQPSCALQRDGGGPIGEDWEGDLLRGHADPTSVVLVLFLVLVTRASRIGDALPFGPLPFGGGFHPLVLTFVLSGSLRISKMLHIPKL
jgi:CDP-diacylglycerol--serine O-phosphatidyltransferase